MKENNLLDENELEQVKKVMQIKKNIISYLDMETFIDNARDIIINSNTFDFRSAASKLYIDPSRPIFILKIKDQNKLKTIQNSQKPIDEVNKYLQEEIIKKISKELTDSIKNSDDGLFKDVPEELKEFIISNIYVIRSNVKENNIQLFFFM